MVSTRRARVAVCALGIVVIGTACRDVDTNTKIAVEMLANACPLSKSRPAHRGGRDVTSIVGGVVDAHSEIVYDDGDIDIGLGLGAGAHGQYDDLEKLLFVIHGLFTYRFRDIAIDRPSLVFDNYNISVVNDGVIVAGRATRKLTFAPRNPHVHRTTVRSDVETGLALEVIRYDERDQATYQMTYTSVEIGNIRRLDSDPPTLPDPPQRLAAGSLINTLTPLEGGRAPAGFLLVDKVAGSTLLNNKATYFFLDRYSDGLQHFFVSQSDPNDTYQNAPVGDFDLGHASLAYTEIGSVTMVWGLHHGRAVAAFGPFNHNLLAGVLSGYHTE